MLDVARDFSSENRLTVLAIGATTDVASALLADPGLAERIEVVAMGFQSLEIGGDEWNVKNDVRAWQILLDSCADLVVGDAAVCKRHLLMSGQSVCTLLADCGTAGQYLTDLLLNWLRTQSQLAEWVTGQPDTWPIWDQVTVAHLLGLTTSRLVSRPVLRNDLSLVYDAEIPEGGRTIRWITAVDEAALWNDLIQKLRHVRA